VAFGIKQKGLHLGVLARKELGELHANVHKIVNRVCANCGLDGRLA
jgi:hypothetical protein